jgi:NAD(P)-dependent dehydrogenase (short-subunit alcohol dehydrogenase family)
MSDVAHPMRGKVCLVTGATSGIGEVTTEALARQGVSTMLVALSPAQGAETVIYLATAPEVEGMTGRYFVERRAMRSSPASYDVPAAHCLWQLSGELARP